MRHALIGARPELSAKDAAAKPADRRLVYNFDECQCVINRKPHKNQTESRVWVPADDFSNVSWDIKPVYLKGDQAGLDAPSNALVVTVVSHFFADGYKGSHMHVIVDNVKMPAGADDKQIHKFLLRTDPTVEASVSGMQSRHGRSLHFAEPRPNYGSEIKRRC